MSTLSDEQRKDIIAIWSKAVETQMHFNEMSVKSRQLGLTFVAGALGLSVVLFSQGKDYAFTAQIGDFHFQINIALLLLIGTVIALQSVRKLDLDVYHQMLRGAVAFGEDLEENCMKEIFDLDKGMTQAISHFSRNDDARTEKRLDSRKAAYLGDSKVTAKGKITGFYRNAYLFLWVAAVVMFVVTNVHYWNTLEDQTSGAAAQSAAPHADAKRT